MLNFEFSMLNEFEEKICNEILNDAKRLKVDIKKI